MTTQTVQLVTFDYGPSLSSVTLRSLSNDSIVATADSCNELSADAGVYAAVFGETSVIPAGTYRLRAVVSGAPINRYVTLAGVDGEVVQSSVVQETQLNRIYDAIYPPTPTDEPLVIVPSAPDHVTGWAVCIGLDGQAAAGIVVTYKLQSPPPRDAGRIFNGSTTGTETSAANGLIQFEGLVPGATYYFTCGASQVSVTIPLDADPEAGYQLPSFTKT